MEPYHSEKLSAKLDFVQDDVVQENPEEIQVKTPKKPKRKRYTPKVVIDDKLAPKPPPKPWKKLPKSKEKKPQTRKTPKQKPQIPKTPKQPKEKKHKLSTSKLTKLDFQSQHLEETNLPDLESQSQHLEAKDFQSQHFPVKINIMGQQSKRKRRLHLFNLIIDMPETKRRKCKKSNTRLLLAINRRWGGRKKRRWGGRKRRLQMNRPTTMEHW
ncbi:hypothetical protein COLO4_28082 [Corchorus olitorius]|uniref:Uncharacterized protein n=1 Tax=Corchorus olitorius TaxID=93759 RepID=A0A1R3HN14_9ROSI|nr:hypothetical protein COLO4_28082 [Corchorus olitorius]